MISRTDNVRGHPKVSRSKDFLIYEPREDSFLLQSKLKRYVRNKSVLDMGSGSGIQAETSLKLKAKSVLAVDINPNVVAHLKLKGLNARRSNLFSNVKEKFDVILFNPPYLPLDSREDKESQLTTTGGKLGDEITLKFLKQVKSHLNPKGRVLLLISSLTPENRINTLLKALRLKKQLIATQKFFMERLYLFSLMRV